MQEGKHREDQFLEKAAKSEAQWKEITAYYTGEIERCKGQNKGLEEKNREDLVRVKTEI